MRVDLRDHIQAEDGRDLQRGHRSLPVPDPAQLAQLGRRLMRDWGLGVWVQRMNRPLGVPRHLESCAFTCVAADRAAAGWQAGTFDGPVAHQWAGSGLAGFLSQGALRRAALGSLYAAGARSRYRPAGPMSLWPRVLSFLPASGCLLYFVEALPRCMHGLTSLFECDR